MVLKTGKFAYRDIMTPDNSIAAGLVEGYGNGKNGTYILSPKVCRTKEAKKGYVRQLEPVNKGHYAKYQYISLPFLPQMARMARIDEMIRCQKQAKLFLLQKMSFIITLNIIPPLTFAVTGIRYR